MYLIKSFICYLDQGRASLFRCKSVIYNLKDLTIKTVGENKISQLYREFSSQIKLSV